MKKFVVISFQIISKIKILFGNWNYKNCVITVFFTNSLKSKKKSNLSFYRLHFLLNKIKVSLIEASLHHHIFHASYLHGQWLIMTNILSSSVRSTSRRSIEENIPQPTCRSLNLNFAAIHLTYRKVHFSKVKKFFLWKFSDFFLHLSLLSMYHCALFDCNCNTVHLTTVRLWTRAKMKWEIMWKRVHGSSFVLFH